MKYLSLLLALVSLAAGAMEPGSQYKQQAESGDPRAQYYLADTYVSSGDYPQAEYWAQKSAENGDGDALALLAQLKIRNPQNADYKQARQLAEKSVPGGKQGRRDRLARVLVNHQAGKPDYTHAITLLQDAAQDPESDSAVDAQMLLGLITASGVQIAEDDAAASLYFKRSSSAVPHRLRRVLGGDDIPAGGERLYRAQSAEGSALAERQLPRGVLIPDARSLSG
ncbi:Sel1 repeat [Raoultella terrigena]|uniref:Sel1 repeat n=1 Tax=Raoultella terrigena TaxID=577 RepID=A0A4U9D5Y6_RAOTE|nr:Sel1 repeat [Raoultella terrigena]